MALVGEVSEGSLTGPPLAVALVGDCSRVSFTMEFSGKSLTGSPLAVA